MVIYMGEEIGVWYPNFVTPTYIYKKSGPLKGLANI